MMILLSSPILCSNIKLAKSSEFKWFVGNNKFVLAYFFDTDCSSSICLEGIRQFEILAEESSHSLSTLQMVKVSHMAMQDEFELPKTPSFVFFRDGNPIIYMGSELDIDEFTAWLDQNRDISTQSLYEDDFEHLTQAASGATTGDWFVMFYTDQCNKKLAIWESVAARLKYKMNIAMVDFEKNDKLADRFNIKKCPTRIFFRLGKIYEHDLKRDDFESLVLFAEGWYKNAPAKRVPQEKTPFDKLVDSIVITLKAYQQQPYGPAALGAFSTCILLIFILLYCTFKPSKQEKLE